MINQSQFQQACGIAQSVATLWYPYYTQTCAQWGITTPADQAMFIAQVGHESGGFKATRESFNYGATGLASVFGKYFTQSEIASLARRPGESTVPIERQQQIANRVYGGRMGNTDPNDGWLYRGGGLIQTTGKANYRSLCAPLGVDLIAQPDLIIQPLYAMHSAGVFWQTNGLSALSGDIVKATKRINGGTNGLDDRKARWETAKAALNV